MYQTNTNQVDNREQELVDALHRSASAALSLGLKKSEVIHRLLDEMHTEESTRHEDKPSRQVRMSNPEAGP